MDVSNSVLIHVALKFSQKQNWILLEYKLSSVFKYGFLRSEENDNLNNFPTLDGVWVLVCPAIFMDTMM